MMELTDAVLLERWTRGRSADAFAELVARHGGMVYGTCRRIVRDPATAEDVAQECFIKLSTHEEGDSPCLAGWLHRVAMRRSLDHLRAARRRGARW